MKNLISGNKKANLSIHIISAVPEELSVSLSEGSDFLQYIQISSILGIQNVLIVLDNMDKFHYTKELYEQHV